MLHQLQKLLLAPNLTTMASAGRLTTAVTKSLPSSTSQLLLLPAIAQEWTPRRHYPARGTKPKIRRYFDFEDLERKTEGKYTHLPLKIRRMGGRDPETGHKYNIHIGPGYRFDYFMVVVHRKGPNDPEKTYDERVIEIRRDANRTPHIALVAGTEGKRWIYATENMEAGQVIRTSGYIPERLIPGVEGNAYPIGALLPDTSINCVELYPEGEKEHVCITESGSCATVVRQQEDFTIVRMPNNHEYALKKECMATVGRLSHVDHRAKIWGSPQMHRRFGFRMSGGDFTKKDGYQGRKSRPIPPVRTFDKPKPKTPLRQRWTMSKKQKSGNYGTAAVPKLVAEFNNIVRI